MQVVSSILIIGLLAGSIASADILTLRQAREGETAAPLLRDDHPARFLLRLSASCDDGEDLSAITISMADTRMTADPTLLDEAGQTELVLEVPSNQLRGINHRLLCTDETGPEGSLKLLLGAFSATASARCLHPERGSRTLYTSTDVDVSLWCTPAEHDQSAEAPGESR